MTAHSEFPSVRATDERENIGVNTSDREPFCALLAARSAVEADARENRGVNPSREPSIADLIAVRCERRFALMGMSGALAVAMLGGAGGTAGALLPRPAAAAAIAPRPGSTLTFRELAHGYDEDHHVAEGYDAQVLIRWGDKVLPDAPPFEPRNLTAAAQAKQFGYNNDYVGFFPLPRGSKSSDHGLLTVNHEYTDRQLMFPGIGPEDLDRQTAEMIDIELAAHGASVVEIKREGGRWQVVETSPYNRRLTALASEFVVTGPAAGHDRLKTKADPTGTKVIGTINNCAGGETPWGTVLVAEENFHQYFRASADAGAEAANYKRMGIGDRPAYDWARFHDRFDVAKEPNEPNRFGWMVEFDPYDPKSVPKKRTALGRCKHEAATTILNGDGRLVIYSGDDEAFEYVYKFITSGKVDPANPAANADLLDAGTLYVGRFDAEGGLTWLPLVFGEGPLTSANGFHSQADVLIETRRAADLVGATPMDRPEDVEPNPVTGTVFMNLTNNTKRKDDRQDAANPRARNAHGHIIEMIPPGERGKRDHAATAYRWSIFLLAGNPANAKDGARYGGEISENGWLSCPDNMAFDREGRIWISTDGAPKFGIADGIWAADVEGPGRAMTRHFYRTPRGAEMCGPCFTPDNTTFFVAVQHPGDEAKATYEAPATRWPDFKDGVPPRPAVVAITRKDGGPVGG
ncbi:PhoX family protein [Blastochloris sulfoviridis]|uniref:PhoX family phosphatase n=1 Tax=Blastochloris sulfoviridis TaxID=50712 RepID=A0A5M6HUT1_9HYPH|nr:PhoX family phosphatase [Blastochloris sulfoviridis]KAA5599622.1 PhoX family phosphatase [Blastochloris sulfoviridis]